MPCSLVLVLVPLVWGQDCVSEDVQVWKFTVGENATITVEGDTDQGCKFVLQNDETKQYVYKSCCYMNKARQQKQGHNMCLKHHQSETCISETRFTVDDHKPRGKCILNLSNFEAGDAGQYNVIFPGESRNNKIKRIVIHEKKAEIIRRIDIGHSAMIFVEGDIKKGEGCKFVATLDTKICCHESNNTRKLCAENDSSKDCDNYKVTTDGNKCTIYLKNFQKSDAGEYKAIFPSDLNDNEIVHVKMPEIVKGESMTVIIVLVSILALTLILILLYFCIIKIKQTMNNEIVNRSWITDQISKDKAILDALRLEDREDFKEKLGSKSILKVSDHYQNNIFHIAADERWTREMGDIVVSNCKEIFPPQSSEDPAEGLELESLTRKYIFSAKISKPHDWFPNWFPRRLLPNYININTQNLEGMTPLHIAAGKNNENAVMSLLENGADPNIQDNDGYTALHKVILFQHCKDNKDPNNIQTVRNLLGLNPNMGDSVRGKLTATNEGQNPLHSAVLKNNLKVIKLILNKQEGGLDTSLQRGQNKENPQNLLNQKWKQTKKNQYISETPIELAVRLGYTNIVKFILDECDNSWGQTEGHHVMQLTYGAARGGHSKIVDILLDGKAFDPKYRIGEDTCLERAIKAKNPVAVNILLGKIDDVGQEVSLTEQLIRTEESNIKSVNIANKTEAQIKSGQMFRQKLENRSFSDETKLEEEKKRDSEMLESFKDIENLNRIRSALLKHVQKVQGNLVAPILEKEKEKEKLSEETIIENLRDIMASENPLSRPQLIHIQKIMTSGQNR